MKPIEGMLIDFVNDIVWEGIMNTFNDIDVEKFPTERQLTYFNDNIK